MKLISFQDILDLRIAPEECYTWAEDMIRHKREAQLPPKISLTPLEGTFCNVMPSILPDLPEFERRSGVKIVTRYPDRVPSLDSKLILMDTDTGEFLALMDADWITAMRTGAVAVHSIGLLARKDARKVAMMGLGNTARATLLMLLTQFPDRQWEVRLLRYKGQEEAFVERFRDYPNVRFTYAEDLETLVRGAEIVISCVTYAPKDFCSDDCFDEGVLVVPVHTRGFTNCDLFFDKVFADDRGHVCHFKNFDRFRQFGEVCDVVNGRIPGRESDRERILAYNIGLSIHDVNFAAHLYRILDQRGLLAALPEVDMAEPQEKFWV